MANVFDRLDRIEKNQTQGKKEKRSALDRLDKIQPVKDTAKKVDADSLSRAKTTPKKQAKTDTTARGSKRKSFFSYDREATSGYGQANRSPMGEVPRNAVRAEKRAEYQDGEKFSVGKLAGGMAVKGATDFAKSISGTLSFLEGAVTKPLDQLMGAEGEFVKSGMFHKLNEDIKEEQEAAREYFQPNVERGGKAAEIADFLGTTTISAIPQGLMATVAGSTKAAQTGVDVVAKAKDLAPGIWNSVRSLTARSAKNPAFWSSFFQTIGNDYEEAIADGASELKAVSYAIGNGLLNAQVEVGGGLETMDEAGDMGIKAWAKTAAEEGNEEVIQGIIQRGLQNLVYEKGNPIASVSDENAVLNPMTSAQEWAGGAFAGGVLSGARIGGNYLAGQAYNRQLANIGSDYQVEPEALVQEGLSFPQGTEARRTAEQMQEKINSGTSLTDSDLGKMVAANEQTMYQQRQLEWANTPAEERAADGDRALLETARSMTREQQETDSRNGQTAEQDESRIGRDIQDNMERVRRAAGALGESGGKALTAAYTEDTAKTIAPKEAVEGFYKVYNAALKGEQLSDTDARSAAALPAHLRYAAQSAGQQDALRAKQAKFFGEKAGLVKDDSWKKAHLSSKTNRTLDALGKALGVQIKFAETVAEGQANAQYGNGVITLALDAKDPVLTSVVHESVHRIRETSPEAYNTLAEFVQQTMTAEGLDFNLSERARLYGTENVSDLTEEMVADAFGRVLNDGKAIERLVQDNRSLAEKVRDVLADIVNAVKRVLNHQNLQLTQEQRAAFQDLEGRMSEMERLFSDALGKEESQNGQKNTAQEGGTAKFSIKEDSQGKVVSDNRGWHWDDLSYRSYRGDSPMSRAGYAMMADDPHALHAYGDKVVAVRQAELKPIAEFQDKIAENWERDKENGTLPYALETELGHLSGEEVAAAFDPDDIVDSANAWDNEDMVQWAYEKVFDGIQGVKTSDGAIVFDEGLLHSIDPEADVLGDELHGETRKESEKKFSLKEDSQVRKLTDANVAIDRKTKSASPVRYSLKTWTASDYVEKREEAAKALSKSLGVPKKKALAYIDDINSIAKTIADDRVRLDYEASPGRSSFVGNTEYGGSIDFSTICAKRRLLTGTFEAIQAQLPNTALTAENILTIRKMMADRGYQVSCGLCYVEGSRANMGQYTKQFLTEYAETNPKYLPNMAEMNTASGQEQVRIHHPEVYEAYEKFMNKLAQRKPKMYQMATEYQGEILNKFKGKKQAESVAEKNRNGGIRFQSFSDFEVIHLIDNMQVIMDMAKVGLAGQAYTKVPNFAWAMGDTGLKINLSLIAKGVDKNGKIILDEVEGMPRRDAEALRKRYSDNVGTILVIFNDDQLKSALNDPFIDFIIPFHRSQWNSAQYEMMGLPANAKDYTMWQNESYIEPVYSKSGKKMRPANYMPNEYWDFNRSGKENAESYLKMCAANNRKPKFSNLLDRNADGSYSLKADGSTDGYWKLLIDFKMYDNDGNGSPQKPVVPNFNMDEAARMMAEYEGGHEKFPVANDVVADFVAQYKKENPDIRYSLKPVPPVRPKSKDWKPGATFDEVKAAHPTLFALDADEADTRNPTQITGTVKSYRKIYDALQAENFDGTILDASSGLGYGTRAGREEYGFDVDDIEPFPDAKYQPNYTDYSALDKTYDVIISNAVLNVMPQDLRDAMVVKIGEMLNPGGRAFINVRGTDVKNAGSKVAINDDLMEYFISNTGSYQKGFTSKELVSYLKDALGDGFTVEPTRKFGAVSAIVTRDGDMLSMDVNEKFSRSDRELLSDYVKKYGAIPRGENPSREILLPRKTAADKKVSQTVRTILEAGATPDGMVPTVEDMVAKGDFSYDAYTDKQAISDAESQIKKVGWAQALTDWTKAVKSGEVSKANTAMGWALYNNAANSGDTKTALSVLENMVEHQRSAAQALQATRILKSMSPETQLYGAQRSVENLQEELNKRYGDKKGPELKIDEDLAERFMKAKDQESRDEILKEIYRDIGRQMPSRFIDRWNAWRYLAMLGNTRTHVRNIVGNAGFMPVVATKNLVGTAIESAVYRVSGGKLNRSKALVWGGKQDRALLSAAWGDYSKVQEAALGSGKYSEFANANRYIEEGRKIFGNTKSGLWNSTGGRALETFRKANSAALDVEDVWFSKPHYAYALSQYCKAHGITAEQIADGKGLKAAREYAILEAQKATYRDTNALSQTISELGRGTRFGNSGVGKALTTITEGILPFRKTPANILARGVEYSPIGLANGIKEALWDVQKGTKTGAEAIDAISAGLSGTGLLALGLYMAAQGLVRGHGGDDDKKKKFEEMQGHQAYALELPDGRSVTLDWLAPEALPFFIGVNLWEETGGERATLSDWMTSTKLVTEPLLEMSCLQSLNAVFDAVGYASSEGLDGLPAALASAGTSYLTQALPTVLGQAERTGEDKRYTTYTEKNAFLTGDIQYTLGKASAKIPGWDYQQIPYIDAWGRTESSGNAGTRAFNNFVNPAYTSQIQNSAMEKELLRLYEATGESGVFPQRAEKYFTVDQDRKDLTAQEYVKYAELKGQSAYQLVTDLVKDKKYQAMSDQDKAAAVENAYKLANQQAKQKVGGYKPESWIIKAAEAEKKHGIDQKTYVLLKTQTAGIESLKDKDGETISNSKGLQIMELVYGYTGLSDKQKEAMFEYLGVGTSIRHYNPGKVKQELEKMKKK